MSKGIKAACGQIIKDGDVISFSFGIPPVHETADVSIVKGKLVATMRGPSIPHQATLFQLKRCVYELYLEETKP